jgi:hypothetical protein
MGKSWKEGGTDFQDLRFNGVWKSWNAEKLVDLRGKGIWKAGSAYKWERASTSHSGERFWG